MSGDEDNDGDANGEDGARDRVRAFANSRTIDLKREFVYLKIKLSMEISSNDDEEDEDVNDDNNKRGKILVKITKKAYLEIIDRALMIMRGKIGGKIDKDLVFFETCDDGDDDVKKTSARKKNCFGCFRVKRKEYVILRESVEAYDRRYRESENNEEIKMKIVVDSVASELIDLVSRDCNIDVLEKIRNIGRRRINR